MDKTCKRNFLFYMTGYFISMTGSQFQLIAIPLYLLAVTGSGMMMGAFSALSLTTMVLTLPVAGVLGDRWNRRNIMIYSDFAQGLLVLLLAFLAYANKLAVPVLFIMQVLLAAHASLFSAASTALLPELVPAGRLTGANAASQGALSLAMLAGPALGAVVYGVWGIKTVFFLNAISFILCGLFELMIRYNPAGRQQETLSFGLFAGKNLEVLKFVMSQRSLMSILGLILVLNLLLLPIVDIIMPFAAIKVIGFSTQQFGYLQTLFVAGALMGSILVGTLLAKASPKKIVKSALSIQAGFLIFLALELHPDVISFLGGTGWTLFWVLGITACLIGFFNFAYIIPLETSLQKLVDNQIRARFFSLYIMIINLGTPLGMLFYGFLLDRVAVHAIMLAACLAGLAVTALFLFLAPAEAYEPHTAPEDSGGG